MTAPWWRTPLTLTALGGLAVTIVGIALLWPTGETRAAIDEARTGGGDEGFAAIGLPSDFFEAEVEFLEDGECTFGGIDCRSVAFRLRAGPDEGELFVQEFPLDETTTPEFAVGEKVVLSHIPEAEEGFQYQWSDRQRRGLLRWLALAFAAAVIALGRWRGLGALAGLAATVGVLFAFVLPAIVDGRSPVLVAIFGSAAIAYIALYVAHGFTRLTTVALLGTLAALAVTAVLSAVVTAAANFSGFAAEETLFLVLVPGQAIDISGLILAGAVLGALGAIDDVTVTQASAVWEVRAADPALGRARLFQSGLRVGRDHIASTVNTLALAYAGAALPLLLLFVLADQSLGTVANSEVVAVEIVRTLVGSIGLVAAVPITTWLAALVASGSPPEHLHRA